MSKFFIHRPVFAWVLAIIMTIASGLAIMQLPVAQYPTIAPPAVAVSATYPGADAQTVQDTVTQVIEQNMNGIDNLMYMTSTSDSAGGVTITLTFRSGIDPDIAEVQVQNKLQLATPLLPQEVQQQGISVYLLIVVGMAVLFMRLPTSFLPDEDQGVFMTILQQPSGATQERTQKVLDTVTDYYLHNEKANVESVFTVNGFSFSGQGQNSGMAFVSLKPWEQRSGAENGVEAIIKRATIAFSQIKDAMVFPFSLLAIIELGTATGFDFELVDQGNLGHSVLTQARNQLLGMVRQHPDQLVRVQPNGLEDTPQFKLDLDVDQEKAQPLGISLADINETISAALGGYDVNDFIDHGRVKKVYVQADAHFRMLPNDINNMYARSSNGEMVPFSSFVTSRWVYGSPRLERYNSLPSMEILGEAAPGKSTGDAMILMEQLASKLPTGIGYDWTGMSYQERLSGNQAPALYAISLIVVFLCLAALYESWSILFSVMLVVPLGVVGALLAASLRGLNNDAYFQVGLLTTIGLSAKNAILIVEFAKDLMDKEGKGIIEATLEASRMRQRPILMTSLAFILGVLPLVISHGAGSGAQNVMGGDVNRYAAGNLLRTGIFRGGKGSLYPTLKVAYLLLKGATLTPFLCQ